MTSAPLTSTMIQNPLLDATHEVGKKRGAHCTNVFGNGDVLAAMQREQRKRECASPPSSSSSNASEAVPGGAREVGEKGRRRVEKQSQRHQYPRQHHHQHDKGQHHQNSHHHQRPHQPRKPPSEELQRIGDYLLRQTIGRGEFAKVKLATHLPTSRTYALKLFRKSQLLTDPEKHSILTREISILSKIRHPNIIRMLGVQETDKYVSLVLEYASRGELFDYILAQRFLEEAEARRLFWQLTDAMKYLHGCGMVHRDLKLENLLLSDERNLIVIDFGFANEFPPEPERKGHACDGVRPITSATIPPHTAAAGHRPLDKHHLMSTSCGSPCYAAPELVTSDGYIGSVADIWSMGIILFAMLCGYLPFDDDPANPSGENIKLLYKYILRDPTPLHFPAHVSECAKDLVKIMIVPDPEKRALMADIEKHEWMKGPRGTGVGGEGGEGAGGREMDDCGLSAEEIQDRVTSEAPVVVNPARTATPPHTPTLVSAEQSDHHVSVPSSALPSSPSFAPADFPCPHLQLERTPRSETLHLPTSPFSLTQAALQKSRSMPAPSRQVSPPVGPAPAVHPATPPPGWSFAHVAQGPLSTTPPPPTTPPSSTASRDLHKTRIATSEHDSSPPVPSPPPPPATYAPSLPEISPFATPRTPEIVVEATAFTRPVSSPSHIVPALVMSTSCSSQGTLAPQLPPLCDTPKMEFSFPLPPEREQIPPTWGEEEEQEEQDMCDNDTSGACVQNRRPSQDSASCHLPTASPPRTPKAVPVNGILLPGQADNEDDDDDHGGASRDNDPGASKTGSGHMFPFSKDSYSRARSEPYLPIPSRSHNATVQKSPLTPWAGEKVLNWFKTINLKGFKTMRRKSWTDHKAQQHEGKPQKKRPISIISAFSQHKTGLADGGTNSTQDAADLVDAISSDAIRQEPQPRVRTKSGQSLKKQIQSALSPTTSAGKPSKHPLPLKKNESTRRGRKSLIPSILSHPRVSHAQQHPASWNPHTSLEDLFPPPYEGPIIADLIMSRPPEIILWDVRRILQAIGMALQMHDTDRVTMVPGHNEGRYKIKCRARVGKGYTQQLKKGLETAAERAGHYDVVAGMGSGVGVWSSGEGSSVDGQGSNVTNTLPGHGGGTPWRVSPTLQGNALKHKRRQRAKSAKLTRRRGPAAAFAQLRQAPYSTPHFPLSRRHSFTSFTPLDQRHGFGPSAVSTSTRKSKNSQPLNCAATSSSTAATPERQHSEDTLEVGAPPTLPSLAASRWWSSYTAHHPGSGGDTVGDGTFSESFSSVGGWWNGVGLVEEEVVPTATPDEQRNGDHAGGARAHVGRESREMNGVTDTTEATQALLASNPAEQLPRLPSQFPPTPSPKRAPSSQSPIAPPSPRPPTSWSTLRSHLLPKPGHQSPPEPPIPGAADNASIRRLLPGVLPDMIHKEISLTVEVCRLQNLVNLYVLRFKRIYGSVWTYKLVRDVVLAKVDRGTCRVGTVRGRI